MHLSSRLVAEPSALQWQYARCQADEWQIESPLSTLNGHSAFDPFRTLPSSRWFESIAHSTAKDLSCCDG